ncbi:MAG: nitroreductase family deazaflavin-dependent oxidoreductase [Anaerolineae bacterium]|nr:nitroreductase family deazaflavin-dependent oxidoreductase [Anaerolineae bacterium]
MLLIARQVYGFTTHGQRFIKHGYGASVILDSMMERMTTDNHFIPYPIGLVRLALRSPLMVYRLGLGDVLSSAHIMVLTTRGRRSGQPRFTPIEFRRHGSKIYLISGWGKRPDWYQNLLVDPLATVQVGRQAYSVLADPVTDPAEAVRAITLFRRVAPGRYDAVLGRLVEGEMSAVRLPELSGQFTIMKLNLIADEPTLPGVEPTWMWVWPILLVLFAGIGLGVYLARSRHE